MSKKTVSRREFGKLAGGIAAASAITALKVPFVHAAHSDLIQVALIGCGGRGTGAAGQALSTTSGPIKLVAMADVFENKLKGSFASLSKKFGPKGPLDVKDEGGEFGGRAGSMGSMDVPPDRQFLGFDAYKKAIDCLKPNDVAIFATPCVFRWVHFKYAIEKGVNVFMEKPVTADAPTTRRMFELADLASKKNLKVGVGLMVRHCKGRQELFQRIQDGQIGDIICMRGYRTGGRAAWATRRPNDTTSELMFQVRGFHSFLWSGGGLFSDYNIHQIDELSWMKNAWPVTAHGTGGRHFRGESLDQNFDSYTVEYTYPDGTKFFFIGRHQDGTHSEFASYIHGTKGSAVVSTFMHTPGRVRIYKSQIIGKAGEKTPDLAWAFPQPEPNPYQLEWDDLIDAIRLNNPYNEVKRGAIASAVTSMGRFAAHTGQILKYDEYIQHDHEYAPDADKFTADSQAPLQMDKDGKYPVPQPGRVSKREY